MAIDTQFGLHGVSVRWRCAYDAHIAGTHKRELQGAGYRCSRHCEGVDIALELAQLLLGSHAKLLLLVDNEQSKVVPLNRLTYQLVRTYKYIYLSLL